MLSLWNLCCTSRSCTEITRRRRRAQIAEKMQGGRTWVTVKTIAHGTHCTVFLAKPRQSSGRIIRRRRRRRVVSDDLDLDLPPLLAVKSAEISDSASLQKEKEALKDLQGCAQILHCYGDDFTQGKNGEMIYNLFFEYASGGNLAELIKNSSPAGGLPESDVKRYTRSILLGLYCIHRNGYVHLNIKPKNVLLVPGKSSFGKKRKRGSYRSSSFDAKIGDFGSAKRVEQISKERRTDRSCLVGTPRYMSPESIIEYKQEPPSDIWALGCVVAEMLSGKPCFSCKPGEDVYDLLDRIGSGCELPRTPTGISKEAQDFLKRCFVRKSMFRWTADMLLFHPFIAEDDSDIEAPEDVATTQAEHQD